MSSKVFYPNVDLREWAAKYGLSLAPKPCSKCGILQHLKTPFITGNWCGLLSDVHECGEQYRFSVAREIGQENEWKLTFKELSLDQVK